MTTEFSEFNEQPVKAKVHRLLACLDSISTGGFFSEDDKIYRQLRCELLAEDDLSGKLPDFVHQYADLNQFSNFIQNEFGSYEERSEFIRNSFRPLFDNWVAQDPNAGIIPVSEMHKPFDTDTVNFEWRKALYRRTDEPERAIIAAFTLLETACKHFLNDAKIEYPDNANLPKLWTLAAEHLIVADDQAFNAILGDCQAVVNQINAVRNSIADEHSQGERHILSKPCHVGLLINFAGSIAAFLIGDSQGSILLGRVEREYRDF